MYSKEQLIWAITHEVHIISHLAAKIAEEHHDHKFTASQRTVKELLIYLSTNPWKQVELIFNGDPSIFSTLKDFAEQFQVIDFDAVITKNSHDAIAMIEQANDEILQEEVILFGWFTKGTRAQILVQMVYGGLMAYKMQLFLQLKHAGLSDINTSNLWMGVDKPTV